jgi:hypothetical protein
MCQSMELSTEEGMGEGKQRECHSLPSQLERTTTTWLVISPPLAVSKQDLEACQQKYSFPIVMVYSGLFNNVRKKLKKNPPKKYLKKNNAFKALNLFLNKYVA